MVYFHIQPMWVRIIMQLREKWDFRHPTVHQYTHAQVLPLKYFKYGFIDSHLLVYINSFFMGFIKQRAIFDIISHNINTSIETRKWAYSLFWINKDVDTFYAIHGKKNHKAESQNAIWRLKIKFKINSERAN